MRQLPTVRIADGSGGVRVINETDFDPAVHQRVDDPPGMLAPEPAGPEPRRAAEGVAGTPPRRRRRRARSTG